MKLNVSSASQAVFPFGEQDSFVITNNGPYTVYVDQDSSINEQSHPIPPTGVMVWDAGRPLWVVGSANMETGSFSEVTITRNSSPSAFSNFVDSVLYEAVSGLSGFIQPSPLIETSAYKFLTLHLSCPQQELLVGSGAAINDYFGVDVIWYDNKGGTVGTERYQSLPYAGGDLSLPIEEKAVRIVMPVRGASCTIWATINGQITMRVLGTTRDIRAGQFFGYYDTGVYCTAALDPVMFIGDDAVTLDLDNRAAQTQVIIPNVAHRVKLSWGYSSGTTVAGAVDVRDARDVNNVFREGVVLPSATVRGSADLLLPLYFPVRLIISPPTTPAPPIFRLHLTWYGND